ncbi:hypothetical protein PAEPH01_1200 [Pancytospora epiphaga]|nr:hypothetical protein PAEPH01_1200 [Pancytospora epiphaga]
MTRKIKIKKPFSYYNLIKEALTSFPDAKATCSMIFIYITTKHPNIFKYSNSNTWKNNIRQLLSKHTEFVRYEGDRIGRLHYWTYRPLKEIETEENLLSRNCNSTDYDKIAIRESELLYNRDIIDKYMAENSEIEQAIQDRGKFQLQALVHLNFYEEVIENIQKNENKFKNTDPYSKYNQYGYCYTDENESNNQCGNSNRSKSI